MKKWVLLTLSPISARQQGHNYEDDRTSILFAFIAIIFRFMYLCLSPSSVYIDSFFKAMVSNVATVSCSAIALFLILTNTRVTTSCITSVVWYLQILSSSALLAVRFIFGDGMLWSSMCIICILEAIVLIRFFWKYSLISLGKSIIAGIMYWIIALYFLVGTK